MEREEEQLETSETDNGTLIFTIKGTTIGEIVRGVSCSSSGGAFITTRMRLDQCFLDMVLVLPLVSTTKWMLSSFLLAMMAYVHDSPSLLLMKAKSCFRREPISD